MATTIASRGRRSGTALAMLACLCASVSVAEEPQAPERPTLNLFGVTGLIDTPTADMQPDANISITAGYFGGYLRNTITAQFLPGIEASFRYSVLNELSPPPGGTTLFDRSFDVKVRLLEEGRNWPAIAIGLQDFLGTGVFSGEYIAATKGFDLEDFGSIRATGGIGWGRFADGNGIENPLTNIADGFRNRDVNVGVGGNVTPGQFFRGENMGFFGGIEWNTPIEGLSAKLEYSPDRYTRERTFGDFEQNVPLNIGLDYRASDELEIGAYYMYGSEFGIRVTITANPFRPLADFDTEPAPKHLASRPAPRGLGDISGIGDVVALLTGDSPKVSFSDPRLKDVILHERLGNVRWADAILTSRADDRCPTELAKAIDAEMGVIDVVTFQRSDNSPVCSVALRPAGENALRITAQASSQYSIDWYQNEAERAQIVEALAKELNDESLNLFGIEVTPDRVQIYLENDRYRAMPRALGRAARALTRTMPPSVELFEITPVEGSLPVATVVLKRSELENQVERPDAARETFSTTTIKDAAPVSWDTVLAPDTTFPRFSWNVFPSTPVNLFDPDQPARFDLAAVATGSVEFLPGLSSSGEISYRIVGDLDDIERRSNSLVEERVRSDIAEYLNQGNPALTRLTMDYVTKVSDSVYARASAGLLERMYAGVSGELLWKPAGQSWGLGVEANYVRQRGFNTLFDMRDYDTFTGHASVYWDTGFYGLSTQVDVGRYLAGDYGGTLSLKRRFANGWEVGGFATFTDIPFDEFGEGSFDKGLFLTIPFNYVLPYDSRQDLDIVLRPLTRDGGARLSVANRLYPLLEDNDQGGYRATWGEFWE
ncbi:MAG: YjbH domain-containing protein [Pseudomonadota bacterium]